MKRCPECGETMRLGMGQWVHEAPAACRIVTLRATAEEIATHARPTGRGPGGSPSHSASRPRLARAPRRDDTRRFGYLTSDGPPAAPGR
jgi:hypothetical protein